MEWVEIRYWVDGELVAMSVAGVAKEAVEETLREVAAEYGAAALWRDGMTVRVATRQGDAITVVDVA